VSSTFRWLAACTRAIRSTRCASRGICLESRNRCCSRLRQYGAIQRTGTSGYATIGAPGNDPYVITVGATNTHLQVRKPRRHGQLQLKGSDSFDHIVKPDLVAPAIKSSRAWPRRSTLVTSFPALAIYPCNSSRSNCGSQTAAPGTYAQRHQHGNTRGLAASRFCCCRRRVAYT